MKTTVLSFLIDRRWVSGEDLGSALNISRSAVWKQIEELRRKGYKITSIPGVGYHLEKMPDCLYPEEVMLGLDTKYLGQEIVHFFEVGSTQDEARRLAEKGAIEGVTVIAETQLSGRGRVGRSWNSPSGSGIYISIILRPNLKPNEALQIPIVAGVAVACAISEVVSVEPKIKWPNDIILGSKKVGGILAEMSAEIDKVNYIILGIGMNVNTTKESFPEEIKSIATSLSEECNRKVERVQLVQQLLRELEALYEEFKLVGFTPARKRWKKLNNTIGQRVKVGGTEAIVGNAIDIDKDGALIVKDDEGNRKRVVAGDVFLRTVEHG
ncbi:MAG: biotin--[acetyl-CoA-carboxylase] ligase [Chloroflexota bacterium]|nr:biotin--[acetyl-CoA-carboxylase] ligase [Chloroflexota bacterium]